MAQSSTLHVVILAAGEGKRMNSARPKVLLPLAGRILLAHVLDTARALEPAAIHVVYGHRGDQVRSAFAHQEDLRWVHQAEQRGTGHAVQLALAQIPDTVRVLVLYGDVPLIRIDTLDALLATTVPLAVLTTELSNPQGYGRVICNDLGEVRAIVEEKDCTPEQRNIHTINTGIIIANAQRLRVWLTNLRSNNAQGEILLTDIFVAAARENEPAQSLSCRDEHEACGANNSWQLAELERHYQRRAAQELCAKGLRLADPARFDLRGNLHIGRDVEIDIDVVLEGEIRLGDEVRIGPYCRIRNSTLATGTVVHAHCDLDGVITQGPCSIGPFARLRPGTEIAAGVHIGNFVETKNASLGNDAKVGHLSYIGDATIGRDVNIGAGTITCNYDGNEKHQTVIEDGAFIGSNTSLVAPVTIGRDSTVGAGSTINKDTPPGELTIARARQSTVPGWHRVPKRKS